MMEFSTLGNIIFGLGDILHSLITVYIWLVIITALLSWFPNIDPFHPAVQFLYRITNPVYAFIRQRIPTVYAGMDLAPLILIIGLNVFDVIFFQLVIALAHSV